MVRRYDRGELKAHHVTDEGFLYLDAYVTRVGVFDYMDPDGSIRRELRPPEEVFAQDSLATLGRKPVTLDHPPVDVTPENNTQYTQGAVGERINDTVDGYVQVSLTVFGKDAIDSVQRGDTREVSCGYMCDLDDESGIWEGEAYDAIQRNIRYNHVALVDRGRAGHAVRVRYDNAAYMLPKSDMVPRVDVIAPLLDYPTAPRDMDWDSDAAEGRVRAWAGVTEGESLPDKYKSAHLWGDPESPDNLTSYKLLIVDIIDGSPVIVPKAVFAVAAAIQGARGGVDIPSGDLDRVQSRVSQYYERFRKEWEDDTVTPPWERDTRGEEMKVDDQQASEPTDGRMPPEAEEELEVKAPEEETKEDTPSGDMEPEVTIEVEGEEEEEEEEEKEKAMELLQKAFDMMKGERDDLMKKVKDLSKALDKKKGAEDALRAQLDQFKTDKADETFEARKQWMAERTELLALAKRLDVEDADKHDNVALMRLIVGRHNKTDETRVDSYSDDYVRGAMAMIRLAMDDSTEGLAALAQAIRTDKKPTSPKGFAEQYEEANEAYLKSMKIVK